MTSPNVDSRFFVVVDEFIELANDHLADDPVAFDAVSAAIVYAAACINSHEAMGRIEELAAGRQDTIDWLVERYRAMLVDNVDEHLVMKALTPNPVE